MHTCVSCKNFALIGAASSGVIISEACERSGPAKVGPPTKSTAVARRILSLWTGGPAEEEDAECDIGANTLVGAVTPVDGTTAGPAAEPELELADAANVATGAETVI